MDAITTDTRGMKAHGIHGGKAWNRDEHKPCKPNVKAQAKLAARLAGFEKDIQSGKLKPGTTRPGSLNRRNR